MKRTALILLALGFSAHAQLTTFKAGQPASAAAVNANFELLQTRLDSLVTALKAKDAQIANLQGSTALTDSVTTLKSQLKALQNSTALTDSVASLRAKVKADSLVLIQKSKADSSILVAKMLTDSAAVGTQSIPAGTVAGFLTAPGADGYLPGSNSTWILAAGQGSVNGIIVPEMRGTFLRGIDLVNSGKAMTGYDSTGSRAAGSYQADAFQGHWHRSQGAHMTSDLPGSGYSFSGLNYGGNVGQDGADVFSGVKNIREPITDVTNGTPRTTTETRPKNVAVYWYVKVK